MKTQSILPVARYRLWLHVLSLFFVLILCGGLTACEKEDVKPHPVATELWVLDRLYFGRSMPEGGEVTEEEWDAFVAEIITPRFPDGLTMWDAEGQWQEDVDLIIRESTFILEIVHLKSEANEKKLAAIVEEYKKRFQQESVLRITHPVDVEF